MGPHCTLIIPYRLSIMAQFSCQSQLVIWRGATERLRVLWERVCSTWPLSKSVCVFSGEFIFALMVDGLFVRKEGRISQRGCARVALCWEQSQGPCCKLASDPCLCAAPPEEGLTKAPPTQTSVGTTLVRMFFKGVDELANESRFIDCVKEWLFQGECHHHCYSLPQWTAMTKLNGGGAPPLGWGSASLPPANSGPPTLRLLSRPVAVANIAILR